MNEQIRQEQCDGYDFFYSTVAGQICLVSEQREDIATRSLRDRRDIEALVPPPPIRRLAPAPIMECVSFYGPGDTEDSPPRSLLLADCQPHHDIHLVEQPLIYLSTQIEPNPAYWDGLLGVQRWVILAPPGGFYLAAFEALTRAARGERIICAECGDASIERWIEFCRRFGIKCTVSGGW